MLVLDFIVYIFYRLACSDPFWNAIPYMGCSFFLSIPSSLLINGLLKLFGVEYNTLYILICFFLTWIILYPFMKKCCTRACGKFGNNRILTKWWVCMISYIALNVIIIFLVFT